VSDQLDILIVEDDEAIATGIALNLKLAGYRPTVIGDGEAALEMIQEQPPDLILLDLGLPKRDGLEVLSDLRDSGDRTPVIVLSARQGEYDKVGALRIGADDYVTKPFALAELLARVDAVLRRTAGANSLEPRRGAAGEPVTFGDAAVDIAQRRISRAGAEISLTHLEFELLVFLVSNPGRAFTRHRILREVWGISHSGSPRTVDNFVAQLRSKLEADPERPRHIITVRGTGYRFDL